VFVHWGANSPYDYHWCESSGCGRGEWIRLDGERDRTKGNYHAWRLCAYPFNLDLMIADHSPILDLAPQAKPLTWFQTKNHEYRDFEAIILPK